MYMFLRRYWTEAVLIVGYLFLIVFFLLAIIFPPQRAAGLEPFFLYASITGLIVVVIMAPISIYALLKRVTKDSHVQEEPQHYK